MSDWIGTGTPISGDPESSILTYKDIRKKFVEISGRYDLVNPDTWEDNGADFYLNMGQRMLDRRLDSKKMIARYPFALTAGSIIVKTTGLRSIKEVWIANAEGKAQLTYVPLNKLKGVYAEESASLENGVPLYYSPAVFRPFPDNLATVTSLYDVEDLLIAGTHYTYNGVIVMPPPSEGYTLTILGLFYSPYLSAALVGGTWVQTQSYWTMNEPQTLLEAALSRLATFAGNITSAREHKEAMLEDLRDLDFDAVDEILAGDMEMEGE
jgi:hypothetical protein